MKSISKVIVGMVFALAMVVSFHLGTRAHAENLGGRGTAEFANAFLTQFGRKDFTVTVIGGKTYRGHAINLERDYVGIDTGQGGRHIVWILLTSIVAVEE